MRKSLFDIFYFELDLEFEYSKGRQFVQESYQPSKPSATQWELKLYLGQFVYSYIVIDEVQVVTRCNSHHATTPLSQTLVGLVKSLVDIHKSIDDRFSMAGTHGKFFKHFRQVIRRNVLQRRNLVTL